MTTVSQHQAKVLMDVTAGATALTDISAGVTAVSFAPTKAVGVHHTFGNDWQQATVGGITTSFSISARVDTTATTAYAYLSGAVTEALGTASRTFEIYAPSNATGNIKWAGEGYVSGGDNLNATAGAGDAMVATFSIITDGTWAKSVAT